MCPALITEVGYFLLLHVWGNIMKYFGNILESEDLWWGSTFLIAG